MNPALVAVTAIFAAALVYVWARSRAARRAELIRRYTLPQGLFEKLRKKRPELSLKDCQLVGHALRQFFIAYLRSGFKEVAMPSQVVDDLWHELILYTRQYELFCKHAFGRFLHHTPAVVMGSVRRSNAGLRRCWWFACLEENINPRKPTRLPLLFALDRKLNIPDGFIYAPDCKDPNIRQKYGANATVIHCGGDFDSRSFDGSNDGFGDSSDSWFGGGDAGGGHGCSGGCSGGCGGGGD
jgi:hypothetical protein